MVQFLVLKNYAEEKLNEFFRDESGEVNIVAIVVLIGIAVLLALIFKEKITELLNTLFDAINTSAEDAVTGN